MWFYSLYSCVYSGWAVPTLTLHLESVGTKQVPWAMQRPATLATKSGAALMSMNRQARHANSQNMPPCSTMYWIAVEATNCWSLMGDSSGHGLVLDLITVDKDCSAWKEMNNFCISYSAVILLSSCWFMHISINHFFSWHCPVTELWHLWCQACFAQESSMRAVWWVGLC